MAKVRANPRWSVPGLSGAIASGWKVNTYIAGTSTLKDTYTDYTESVANANPVILDSRGEATIYWNDTYKVVVTDENDVTIWTEDNYGEGEDQVVTGNFNLVKNGSFETDTVTSGEPDDWTIVDYSTGVHAIDATDQYHGLNSLKFTSIGTGGGYATSDYFEVQEGKTVFISWVMKSSVADVRNVVDVIWYTSAKTSISTTNIYDDSTTNPTSWTVKAGSATAPSTARYAQIRVYGCHSSDATSGSTWFDDVGATNPVSSDIYDDNGNEVLVRGSTASAVNEITINNAATGNAPEIIPSGDDTNIDLQLNGKGTGRVLVPVRGCLVYLSGSALSFVDSTELVHSWDAEIYDTDAIHDNVTNNSRLTVPSGVTKAKILGQVQLAGTTNDGSVRLTIDPSAAFSVSFYSTMRNTLDTTQGERLQINTPVIDVAAGDYFELRVRQENTGAATRLSSTVGTSWFAMEIIE